MADNDYLSQIHSEELDKFVVYGDLNCPFCFALHERFDAWSLLGKIEWRLIVHAPELSDAIFSLEDESLLANEVFAEFADHFGRGSVVWPEPDFSVARYVSVGVDADK